MQPSGAQQYQAQIEAVKAMVNLVEVDEDTFRLLLRSREHPTLVSGGTGALWFKKRTYLTSYDGFVFLLKAPAPLDFSEDAPGAFYVEAKGLNIPFL
jgi:hypothetical protein